MHPVLFPCHEHDTEGGLYGLVSEVRRNSI